jgi:hypothetical protein
MKNEIKKRWERRGIRQKKTQEVGKEADKTVSFKGTVSPDRICLKITAKDTVGLTGDIWNAGQNT